MVLVYGLVRNTVSPNGITSFKHGYKYILLYIYFLYVFICLHIYTLCLYTFIFIYIYIYVFGVILDKYKIIWFIPSSVFTSFLPPVGDLSSISYFKLQITCILQFSPKLHTYVFLTLSSFCGYSLLYSHIWGFWMRNHRWERTFSVCLYRCGSHHSPYYSLGLPICLKFLDLIYFTDE